MKNKEPNNEIGKKLRELRIAHRYKQADIAAIADIRQATYSQYETGMRTPSSLVLYRIAKFYGLTVDDFLKLCIDLDDDIYFNVSAQDNTSNEEAAFVSFTQQKPYHSLSLYEQKLLFEFQHLKKNEQEELIEYAKFKRHYKK